MRERAFGFILAIFLAIVSVGCGGPSAAGPRLLPAPATSPQPARPGGEPLRLASLSANVLRTNREVGPILRYLEARLARRFDLVYCRSYRDIADAVEQGRCEFAWLSAQTYLALRDATGCEPVVQLLKEGSSTYRGLLVTGPGPGPGSLDALKGKRLALVDRSSTSGFAYPMAFFRSHGLDPARGFASVSYTGSHESALMAVLRGLADAACIEEHVMERLRDKVDVSGIRIVGVTGEIPHGPIVALKTVPLALRDAVAAALIAMDKAAEGVRIAEGLRKSGEFTSFGPVSDRTYDGVRRVRREAGLDG